MKHRTDSKNSNITHIFPDFGQFGYECCSKSFSNVYIIENEHLLDAFMVSPVIQQLQKLFKVSYLTLGWLNEALCVICAVDNQDKDIDIILENTTIHSLGWSVALLNDNLLFYESCCLMRSENSTPTPGCSFYVVSNDGSASSCSFGLFLKLNGETMGLTVGHPFRSLTQQIEVEHGYRSCGIVAQHEFNRHKYNPELLNTPRNIAFSVSDYALIKMTQPCSNTFSCLVSENLTFPLSFTNISDGFDMEANHTYYVMTKSGTNLLNLQPYFPIYRWENTIDEKTSYSKEYAMQYKGSKTEYNQVLNVPSMRNEAGDCGNIVFHIKGSKVIADGMFFGCCRTGGYAIFSTMSYIKSNSGMDNWELV